MLSNFFEWIWKFISENAMKVWAGIMTFIVAVFAWLNIATPGWLDDYTTAEPTTTVTETTEPTASSTTTTTTTTTETQDPTWVKVISIADIEALGLSNVSITVTTINAANTITNTAITGPKMKEVLEALGADMSRITGSSTLAVVASDAPTEYPYTNAMFMGDAAVLAMGRSDSPRLYPAPSVLFEGTMYVDNGLCCKYVQTLTLTY